MSFIFSYNRSLTRFLVFPLSIHRFRGLTTVSCDTPPQALHGRTKSLAASFKSSSSISSYSSGSSDSSVTDDSDLFNVNELPFGPEPRPSQLQSSFSPDELLLKSDNAFAVPTLPPSQINLRNFKLQAAKIASLSDIVVYSADGLASPELLATAERFLEAHKNTRKQRAAENGLPEDEFIQYNVFVIVDRFEVFERRLPHLVAVSSNGFRRHKIDFFEQEKQEMRKLTQASPIADGVWLGNTGDVPLPQDLSLSQTPRPNQSSAADATGLEEALEQSNSHLREPSARRTRLASSDSSSSLEQDIIEDGNPHKFNICIEAHDQAVMPSPDDYKQIDAYLARINPKAIEPRQIVHIECSSSSQTCLVPADVEQMLVPFLLFLFFPLTKLILGFSLCRVENTIHMVTWIRQQTKPAAATVPSLSFGVKNRKAKQTAREPCNVLLHTADGYTDTSLVALAYIMYDRGCTLPQAYLHLQNVCQRSFFVYPADVAFLSKLETRLAALVTEERRIAASDDEPESPSSSVPSLLRGRFSRSSSPAASKSPASMSALDRCLAAPWFYSDRFDGHFPSRILPFLYLGNINHASNALMLKELGITHVVSIGESALIPPKSPSPAPPAGLPASAKARLPTNSLWLEASLGNIEVLDLPGIADDGIDSIRPFMEISERFIEQARVKGGKVLVHCRVGVSRSATLVTAFVMKHMGIDLASAYLLVRARRLNILIRAYTSLMAERIISSDTSYYHLQSLHSPSSSRYNGTKPNSTVNEWLRA